MKAILFIALILCFANCSLETIGLRHKLSQIIQEHQSSLQEKQMSGGWIKQPLEEFEQQNNSILITSLDAVEAKYNLSKDGYEYEKLLQVTTQVVAGINYKVLVQYAKDDAKRIFEVQQYVVPWNQSANSITKVEEISSSSQ
ncbi:unnamed protein product (macronuclear) [Paramecium tetraurelia]|uniref:Cystatin domain-containing protein n=1 Tax=Paramecium tetraurelia TaxID=5888 RepID=A0EIL6_PARTE|nr:uncharacterized protein GSPATT00027486001 [Paramecium tetraurelia]CAK95157.1 unnamed protein product [Paramecium tetraurelia]|eukprot:XP_001462530.1 hypothetical protein (macronuclear) [Paramecium tetraurelia strain d4-2]